MTRWIARLEISSMSIQESLDLRGSRGPELAAGGGRVPRAPKSRIIQPGSAMRGFIEHGCGFPLMAVTAEMHSTPDITGDMTQNQQ